MKKISMKKWLAVVMVLAMVFATNMMVFAEGEGSDTIESADTPDNTASADVDIKIDKTANEDIGDDPSDADNPTIYVTVEWTSLDFTYSLGEYDTTERDYLDGSWKDDYTQGTITVTNYSNTPIGIDYSWNSAGSNSASTKDGVTATLSTTSDQLPSGYKGVSADAPDTTVNVDITGVPTVSSDFTLDTIVITISDISTEDLD